MAEKIRELKVGDLPRPVRYITRQVTTGSGSSAITRPRVVVFVTDLFRAMGYANPTKSASAMLSRANRSDAVRNARVGNVTYNVLAVKSAIPLILSCTRDVPAIKVALVDALRELARSVNDADI